MFGDIVMTDGLREADYRGTHVEAKSPAEISVATFHRLIVNGYLLLGVERESRDDIGKDQMHWWIFKREDNLAMLSRATDAILPYAKKLKDEAKRLKRLLSPASYEELTSALARFVADHESEVTALCHYPKMLEQKDVVAPGILFTYRVWGTTQQWDRTSADNAGNAILSKDLQECIETALGLIQRSRPAADWVEGEMRNESNMDDADFDEYLRSPKGARRWLNLTSIRVLEWHKDYWDNVLQSLRNIQLDIQLRTEVMNLLTDSRFWSECIRKMIESPLEDQLWDFKESLALWHTTGTEKKQKEVDFCERVAAFANAHGGALVIGVSNDPPRKIVGLKDPENRIKNIADLILRFCEYGFEFTRILQVPITDDHGATRVCLVIAVAQTRDVVGVKNVDGRYSYPRRLGTGISRTSRDRIQSSKSLVAKDNFNFIAELYRITYHGFISFSYGWFPPRV